MHPFFQHKILVYTNFKKKIKKIKYKASFEGTQRNKERKRGKN